MKDLLTSLKVTYKDACDAARQAKKDYEETVEYKRWVELEQHKAQVWQMICEEQAGNIKEV